MAESKTNYRVAWELDEDNMVATAILKQKDSEGEMQEVERKDFDLSTIEQAGLRQHVALYGLSKVMQDRSSGTPTGPEKLEAMGEVFQSLAQGQWKRERSGGGGGGGVAPEVEAIAEVKGVSIAQASKAWKQQSDEQKEAIRSNLADKIQEVKERRKESGEVDLSDIA